MSEFSDIGAVGEQIERLTESAISTEILTAPNTEPLGVYYLVGPDGKAQRIVSAAPRDKSALADPAALIEYIKASASKTGGVFVSFGAVVFVSDLSDRRDYASCKLVPSDPFDCLFNNAKQPKRMGQVELIRLLRIVFRNCIPDGNQILRTVREMKWNVGEDGNASIQHGTESMGRQILAKVQGLEAIPEEITFSLPIWDGFTNPPQRIACAIEVFPAERVFSITPYPGQVEAAREAALLQLAELFAFDTSSVPVFRGDPWGGGNTTR